MRPSGHPARLVVALSVAATLAVFLLYTSLAGGATRTLTPGSLHGQHGIVDLSGVVVGPVRGDADAAGMTFRLRDEHGSASVPVLYRGSVPDLFRSGRRVFVRGRLVRAVFRAVPGSLLTKCPSKYVASK